MPLCDVKGFYALDTKESPQLHITARVESGNSSKEVVSNATVPLGALGKEITLDLEGIGIQTTPFPLSIQATLAGCESTFYAQTELLRVADRTDGGTVTKLDRKDGGLLVQDYKTEGSPWMPLMPYSYYTDWGNYLSNSTSNLDAFKAYGFNIIHITPPGGSEPFNWTQFDQFMDRMDELQLWLMYDMRHTYLNISSMTEQVNHLKGRKSLLLWYTADEPDGNSEPLNGTKIAYDTLRELDPYKPVSLVLNCYNFHFSEYIRGADIIMEDVYPIATNLTWSSEWNTTCNTTYGDCGCDDCHAPPGSIKDVRDRYIAFENYETWLGPNAGPPKAIWGVPQAFGGSEYWKRPPTAQEEAAMAMLRINSGAKGIVAWTWPTTDELANVTGDLAKMVSRDDVTAALLGANPKKLETNVGNDKVDVAMWKMGKKILVSAVAITNKGTDGKEVVVNLPRKISSVDNVLWGNGTEWQANGQELKKSSMGAYEVSVFTVC